MITESDPIHIDLDLPGINCDKPLDPSGKQLKPPLPQCNHTLLFIGKPRSGKSSQAFSMVASKGRAYYRLFNRVHLIIPPSSLSSLRVKELRTHRRVYPELTLEVLEKIDKETDELNRRGKDCHSLVIYDDVGSAIKSDHHLEEALKRSSWNFRHRCLSQWYLLQTFRSLSLGVRKVATHLFIFKLAQNELELIQTELILWIDRKQWLEVCRHVFSHGAHTAIFADLERQELHRVTDQLYYLLQV